MNWYTSDQHFWHANVIKYCQRPFKDVEEMNEALIHNWNSVVKPGDVVWSIGDFSLSFRSVETITNRLNGEKNLILGNHDFAHPANDHARNEKNREKWVDKYLENGWSSVLVEWKNLLPNGMVFRLSHLPYLQPEADEKQNHHKHRPADDGVPLLCGHVHEKWKVKHTMKGTPQINVGVDVWNYKPVSEDELCKMFIELPEICKRMADGKSSLSR